MTSDSVKPATVEPASEAPVRWSAWLGHCFILHKWSKWTHYKQPMRQLLGGALHETFDIRQRRECERCGKIQDEYVA